MNLKSQFLLHTQRKSVPHFYSNEKHHQGVFLAPRVGIEPTTSRLTGGCSTTELPRNTWDFTNSTILGPYPNLTTAECFPSEITEYTDNIKNKEESNKKLAQ